MPATLSCPGTAADFYCLSERNGSFNVFERSPASLEKTAAVKKEMKQ